jgi:hypothetical protein
LLSPFKPLLLKALQSDAKPVGDQKLAVTWLYQGWERHQRQRNLGLNAPRHKATEQ